MCLSVIFAIDATPFIIYNQLFIGLLFYFRNDSTPGGGAYVKLKMKNIEMGNCWKHSWDNGRIATVARQ